MNDSLGAFRPNTDCRLAGAADGPLRGLTFAAKDIFDIEGHVTGCGNPDWLATHAPAAATAPAVRHLVDSGAEMVGKTITDELAFSLNGENAHYGTPLNSAAPNRIPGGSSSGSASAVAGLAVDFALGSDTGGSVRAPASYCGLYGLRPSHGAVPLEGVMPLAPSFDTVGWFARSADLLAAIGDILLPDGPADMPTKVFRLEAAFDLVLPVAGGAVADAADRVIDALAMRSAALPLDPPDLADWLPHFQALQWREIWQSHGAWIENVKPTFGPGIGERFTLASRVTDASVAAANRFRDRVTSALTAALEDGAVVVLPTVPSMAPLKGLGQEELVAFRNRALSQLCVSGLTRLPQISLPLAEAEGCPVGISLIGPRGGDRLLLRLAQHLSAALPPHES